jgi:hypothetical protein
MDLEIFRLEKEIDKCASRFQVDMTFYMAVANIFLLIIAIGLGEWGGK